MTESTRTLETPMPRTDASGRPGPVALAILDLALRAVGHDYGTLRRTLELKASYIDRHPLPDRCVDGRLPLVGTTIDESSGSTGTPYNWARSATERDHVRRMISFFARYTYGDAPLVVLNAFSMGAWATGLTTAIALEGINLAEPPSDCARGTPERDRRAVR